MNRTNLSIVILMGLLSATLWAIINIPTKEPPWPAKVQGFSFSPMRGNQSPLEGRDPSIDELRLDLALLAADTRGIRVYTVSGVMAEIPRLAAEVGLEVTLGAYIDDVDASNQKELDQLIRLSHEHYRNVVRLLVGNEVILKKAQTVEQMIAHIDKVRKSVYAPVSTSEPWHIWLKNPELVKHVDYIAVHLLPYWEGLPVDTAVDYVAMRYNELRTAYPGKPIIISEVGWPSNGRTRQGSVATQANQAKFLRRFLNLAERNSYTYFVIEAFDQVWKRKLEGEVGAHWGVYNNDRERKFSFTEPVSRIPDWQGLAAITIGVAVVLLAVMLRDSGGMRHRGLGFIALVAYGASTMAVWMVYDFFQQYVTISSLVVGLFLFIAALGVVVVLLAEAHEWAEALWLTSWRRMPHTPDEVRDEDLSMVSVHVPAYNEPPEMLIQTLDALAALDYPNYEVLVIDNNTKDPAVWEPVRDYCAGLGPRFRFFHVDPLAGFKAGALNLALRETDPRAEFVAVIDSDYEVTPDWLRAMIPMFTEPNMAIAQAPQDYRDGDENLFKAMSLAEYRGFFHIGMVTRNERNAIIQHGTMTIVRRRVLDEVGGWAEWCITEDAELGLRIFERGYAATYTPRSHGRGLMPDTFRDFKKQRFRWAYGAVMIIRSHLGELIGTRPAKLSMGQRYHFIAGWLPWFADGFCLIFNLAALCWSVGMIFWPEVVAPPHVIFAALPLFLIVFKLLKMFFLYRLRIAATRLQAIAAGIAGLALSHVIARAILTGCLTRSIGFFRTPKQAKTSGIRGALFDTREELTLMVLLLAAALGVLTRGDGDMLDVRVWSAVLAIQTGPYLASVLLSLISAMPHLRASLIGHLGQLGEDMEEGTRPDSGQRRS